MGPTPLRVASIGIAAVLLSCAHGLQAASPTFRGMSLQQAIAALEHQGLDVLYSTALVKPWMSVRAEPRATEPGAMLDEILAPFGLRSRAGPNGVLAVVRASESRAAAPTTPAPTAPPRVPLEEIVVAGSQYELARSLGAAPLSLTAADIEKFPDIGDDALRAVARLPGTTANGLTARTHVRGGEVGETLVRFDGLRLYNPYHLKDFQSIFSAIDPRVVSSVEVYTGGFAAGFGDRMSGVVDIVSLSPPSPRYREISLTFFNTSALSAGRVSEGRGEWVVSARRSNLDFWYGALSKEPGSPRFADAFAKFSWRVNDALRVTAGTLYFEDQVSLSAEDDEERATARYTDRYYWLRFQHEPRSFITGTTVLARTGVSSGRSGVVQHEGLATGRLNEGRSLQVDSLQSDWSWRVNDRWLLQFGGDLRRARGSYAYEDEVEFDLLIDTSGAATDTMRERSLRLSPARTTSAVYASARYAFTPQLTMDVGMRGESDQLGPRWGVRYQLGDQTFMRMSWGRVYQSEGLEDLQIADGVTEFFPPQRADHSLLGIEHRTTGGLTFRAEVYDKRLAQLRPRYENLLNPLSLLPELMPDRIRIAPDHARAQGLELMLSRKAQALSWWLGYSWSTASEHVMGVKVARSWDQTHSVSAGLDWSTAKWSVGAGIIHRSGWPATAVIFDDTGEFPVLRAGTRNALRSSSYTSADVRIERRFALERSSLSVFLEIANLFDRRNPCCTSYEIDDESDAIELERETYVPRMPSLGVLWQF